MDDSVQAQRAQVGYVQQGIASWYGPRFRGRDTASGERFNQNELTAAHRTLPLGTKATVTNLRNGKKVEVEINDRGPYARGRILDLSKAAAERLDMDSGITPVRVEVTQQQ
jgi:rare lipoprotein A